MTTTAEVNGAAALPIPRLHDCAIPQAQPSAAATTRSDDDFPPQYDVRRSTTGRRMDEGDDDPFDDFRCAPPPSTKLPTGDQPRHFRPVKHLVRVEAVGGHLAGAGVPANSSEEEAVIDLGDATARLKETPDGAALVEGRGDGDGDGEEPEGTSSATACLVARQWTTRLDIGLRRLLRQPPDRTLRSLVWDILYVAMPTMGSNALFFLSQTITMMFVGRELGVGMQADYAIAISFFNVTGMSVVIGIASALDTLCSQGFGRDPTGRESMLWFQRSLVISAALCIPIALFFLFLADPVMRLLFGDQLGPNAAVLLKYLIPYLVSNSIGYSASRMLASLKEAHLSILSNVASLISCPLFNWLLTGGGLPGACAAIFLTNLVLSVSQMIAAFALAPKKMFTVSWRRGVDPAVWDKRGFIEFAKIGIPSFCSIAAEWWSFEVLFIVVAPLGDLATSAISIAMNFLVLFFSVPGGLGSGLAANVGNALGAKLPRLAEAYFRVALFVSVLFIAFDAAIIYLGANSLFGYYTNDPDLLHLMTSSAVLIAIFHVADSAQFILQGAFRGAGHQEIAAKCSLATLWCVGLPASWLLSRHGFGAMGVLGGFCLSLYILFPMLLGIIVKRWDWDAMAEEAARKKVEEEEDGDDCGAEMDGELKAVDTSCMPVAERADGVDHHAPSPPCATVRIKKDTGGHQKGDEG